MDDTNEALKIWGALKPMIDAEIAEKTTSCVRSKKMNVVSAPSGTTIGVCEPFDTKIYHIPYVSSLAKASVGDTVWVKWYFNNASTMIATSYGDGLDDVSYPLPISLGGTGASTKANAKTALDIDDLETAMGGVKFIRKTVDSSGGKVTYTFTNYCAFVILCSGANANVRAQIHGNVTSSGSVSVSQYDFGSSPGVSTSTSTNKLVLTNGNTNANSYTCMIIFYGTAPTAVAS